MATEPKLQIPPADTTASISDNADRLPKVKELIQKHPDYVDPDAGAKRWDLLTRLTEGGAKVNLAIKQELLQNPDKRPIDMIKARAGISTYINVLGSTINRVTTQLFEQKASYEGNEDSPFWEKYLKESAFLLDADDDARAGFSMGLKDATLAALTCGQAIAEISTSNSGTSLNLKDQIENGELDPYVVILPRTAMWDWKISARGFEFVKLHRYKAERANWMASPIPVHTFTIYERDPNSNRITLSQYEIRPNPLNPTYKKNPELFNIEVLTEPEAVVSVVTVGNTKYQNVDIFHQGSTYDFPVKTLTIPANLCIGDQLFDLAKENFNIRAGIDWKIHSTLFSMPVLSMPEGEDDVEAVIAKGQKFGDGYMLCLPHGASIDTLDMSGGGIAIALTLLERNKSDILDQLQQIATSAASTPAALGRSAAKTLEDKKPEVVMLEVIGMSIRLFAYQILKCSSIARNESPNWKINGFDNYLGDGVAEMLEDIAKMLSVGINTLTLRKESMEKTANAFGKKYNIDSKKMAIIIREIESLQKEELDKPVLLPVPPESSPSEETQNEPNASNSSPATP